MPYISGAQAHALLTHEPSTHAQYLNWAHAAAHAMLQSVATWQPASPATPGQWTPDHLTGGAYAASADPHAPSLNLRDSASHAARFTAARAHAHVSRGEHGAGCRDALFVCVMHAAGNPGTATGVGAGDLVVGDADEGRAVGAREVGERVVGCRVGDSLGVGERVVGERDVG